MYQGREQGEFLVESQVPTVLAGERKHTRCSREKMGQGNFRKMVGGYGAYFFSLSILFLHY